MSYDADKLSKGEKVIYVTRQHILVLLKQAFRSLLTMLVSLALIIFIAIRFNDPNPSTLIVFNGISQADLKLWSTLALLVIMVIAIAFFVSAYLIWNFEQYIITNERVIKITGIINKNENATTLDKINDINTQQSPWGRLFGYGRVELLTANESGNTVLEMLNRPYDFKKTMLNAKNGVYGNAGLDPLTETVGKGGQNYAPPPPPQYQQNQPQYQQPQYQQAQPGVVGNAQQIAEAIQQLASLRDTGAISPQEFEAKKAELMSRL